MHTWIEQATAKVAHLNKELADLRKRSDIATKSSSIALEMLRVLTSRATEAAERSGSAAAESMIAAKKVANTTNDPTRLELMNIVGEAEVAAKKSAKFAAETANLVHEVLLSARTLTAYEKDVTKIQDSIIAALIVIRAAEAATTVAKLAQSVTALASSITLTAH